MITRFIPFFALIILTSAGASADLTKELRSGDSLRGVAEAIGVQLGDNNISTGRTGLSAHKLNTNMPRGAAQFKALTQELFQEAFRDNHDRGVPADAKLAVRAAKFEESMVAEAVLAMGDSNAFDPGNGELDAGLSRALWAVLRKLPVTDKTMVGVVKTRTKRDTEEEARNIYFYVFLDLETGKLVQLYLVEGTM